ncbi:MAG: hypothetical protein Q9213_005331 [Squamulea squamosa]
MPERPRPQVPLFSHSTPDNLAEQPADMISPDTMHGSSSQEHSPSSCKLTSPDSDFTAAWDVLPDSTYQDAMLAHQTSGEQIGALKDTLLRLDSASSFETPQTVSPYQVELSTPASGYATYESTPATNWSTSPPYLHSTDVSPIWEIQPSPAMTDNQEYEPNDFGSRMFPELPDLSGSDRQQVPDLEPTPFETVAMTRKKSSPGKSPPSPLAATPAGVKKQRRGILKVICPDPTNEKEVKTARNTLAARKSRARKVERQETLVAENNIFRTQVEELTAQAEAWKQRALARGWREGDD